MFCLLCNYANYGWLLKNTHAKKIFNVFHSYLNISKIIYCKFYCKLREFIIFKSYCFLFYWWVQILYVIPFFKDKRIFLELTVITNNKIITPPPSLGEKPLDILYYVVPWETTLKLTFIS